VWSFLLKKNSSLKRKILEEIIHNTKFPERWNVDDEGDIQITKWERERWKEYSNCFMVDNKMLSVVISEKTKYYNSRKARKLYFLHVGDDEGDLLMFKGENARKYYNMVKFINS
jgi:hypothetical protein